MEIIFVKAVKNQRIELILRIKRFKNINYFNVNLKITNFNNRNYKY